MFVLLSTVLVGISTALAGGNARPPRDHRPLGHRRRQPEPLARPPRRSEAGQATAEYALVLVGVATVALLLAAWAARSGKIGELFDAVVDQLIDKVG